MQCDWRTWVPDWWIHIFRAQSPMATKTWQHCRSLSPQNRGTWNWILLKCCCERACSKASIGHTTNKSANRWLLAKNDVIIAEHLLQIGMFSLTSTVFGHYRSRNLIRNPMEMPVPRCIATASNIAPVHFHGCNCFFRLFCPSPSGE